MKLSRFYHKFFPYSITQTNDFKSTAYLQVISTSVLTDSSPISNPPCIIFLSLHILNQTAKSFFQGGIHYVSDKKHKNRKKNHKKDQEAYRMGDDKNKKQGEETREEIKESGQLILDKNKKKNHIQLITIIGEIEGHDNLGSNSKTTKY